MRRSVLFVVLALVALVYSASAMAGGKLVSARGQGGLDDGNRTFSFSARQNADGSVKGEANLVNRAFSGANGHAPYQLHVDVVCMKAFGNTVYFGGTVKRTNDPSLVDAVFFAVQDNGEPGNSDKISRVFFWDDDPETNGDPMACLNNAVDDFPLEPIQNGNIQVRAS